MVQVGRHQDRAEVLVVVDAWPPSRGRIGGRRSGSSGGRQSSSPREVRAVLALLVDQDLPIGGGDKVFRDKEEDNGDQGVD